MGGQIGVESVPGRGSNFTFTAWFGLAEEGARRRRVIPQSLVGLHVLVVDDNPGALEIIHAILSSLRFRVELARSGEEAVEAVAKADAADPFQLVLMDWKMPGIDGIEATRRITAQGPAARKLAVIMMSAAGGIEGERARAREAGASDFLSKPLTASTVVDAIMRVFAPEMLPEKPAAQKQSEAGKGLRGGRVLLVEDNDINQQIAVELMKGAGLEIDVAANGREAVEMLAAGSGRYDMVLMDIQMPELDGYEATRRIRAEPWGADIPIIAMTAHALDEERHKALAAGMNDHISKPLDPELMFVTMSRYYHGRGTSRTASPDLLTSSERGTPLLQIVGIDTAAGLRRVADNSRLYADLLRRLADEHEDTPEKSKSRWLGTTGSSPNAWRTPSTESRAIWAPRRSKTRPGSSMRRRREREPSDQVEESRLNLADALSSAAARIREALPKSGATTGSSETATPGELKEILARLDRLVSDSDGEAYGYFEKTRGKLESACPRETVQDLRDALKVFDFSAARRILAVLEKPEDRD